MTAPDYIVHEVSEEDVTVDWFFARWRSWRPVAQFGLVLVSWCFALLPLIITIPSLLYRDDPDRGWWHYPEGYVLWRITVMFLAVLLAFFAVGFLVLHAVDRAAAKRRAKTTTYDAERLAQRLEIAEDWYASKFGPESRRRELRSIRVEGHSDIETYELRSLYRTYGVDR